MTHDDLAETMRAHLVLLHKKIDALPEGPQKRRLDRLAKVAHGALEHIAEEATGAGLIRPLSGGDPKPTGG